MKLTKGQLIIILAVLGPTMVWASASTQEPQTSQTVYARQFVAMDETGNNCASFGIGSEGVPFIAIRGAGGKARAILRVLQSDEAAFGLVGPDGSPRISVIASEKGGRIVASDSTGSMGAFLGITPNDVENRFALHRKDGRMATFLIVNDQDMPVNYLFDKDGSTSFAMIVPPVGPQFAMGKGKGHINLKVYPAGPSISLTGEDGKPRAITVP